MGLLNKAALAAIVAVGTSLSALPQSASAATILTFAQVGTAQNVTGINNGNGTSTISSQYTLLSISGFGAPAAATPFTAFLDLTMMSTGPAITFMGSVFQTFSGMFSITSTAAAGGLNYLSGTFNDLFQGFGSGATVSGSTPPAPNVTFTSAVLSPSQLGEPRAVSFSFTNYIPPVSICNPGPTICGFNSNIAGNMSANPVPEPASLALFGAGLLGLGLVRRNRRNRG